MPYGDEKKQESKRVHYEYAIINLNSPHLILMTIKKITYRPVLSFQNQITSHLRHQITQQKQVLQAVQAVLPEHLAKQVRHCLIKEQKLLVYTDSAVWASQLRFYNAMMLTATEALTRETVVSVQIRITIPPSELIAHSERKARLPAPEKIAELQKDSLSIADDTLRLALLKLGATLERLSKQSDE